MIDVAITKMSSKGQVVIPNEMRAGLKEGDKLLIIKRNGQLIMKKANSIEKELEEDLEFAKRTEEALLRYEKGLFKKTDSKKFEKELQKW